MNALTAGCYDQQSGVGILHAFIVQKGWGWWGWDAERWGAPLRPRQVGVSDSVQRARVTCRAMLSCRGQASGGMSTHGVVGGFMKSSEGAISLESEGSGRLGDAYDGLAIFTFSAD